MYTSTHVVCEANKMPVGYETLQYKLIYFLYTRIVQTSVIHKWKEQDTVNIITRNYANSHSPLLLMI